MANTMASVPFASMVNLIADEKIVPEFLQHDMTKNNLAEAVLPLLDHTNATRKIMLAGFDKVRRTLGLPGVYHRAADAILSRIIIDHD